MVKFDLCLTDPPYGIDLKYESHDDNREGWFDLMKSIVPIILSNSAMTIMPSSGIDRLGWWYVNFPPKWIIAWYKGSPGHLSKIGFNDWESILVFGKHPKPMHDYISVQCNEEMGNYGHPCPKPLKWASWFISRASNETDTILDPFAGSGTTGRAAKDLGRKCTMIELEEKYCEIAARRQQQEVLAL